MTTQTFHLFPLLPGELRDQIWDLAVRPRGYRGVHMFSVFGWLGTIPENFKHQLFEQTKFNQYLTIGAPLPVDDMSPHSWTTGNKSTYTIDGGLFNACKESHKAICRRYNLGKWSKFFKGQQEEFKKHPNQRRNLPVISEPSEDVPATFIVQNDGAPQYFIVLPCQDLILLQPWQIGSRIDYAIGLMPFTSEKFGFGGIRDVALEFDPSWNIDELQQYQREYEGKQEGDELDENRWSQYDSLVQAARLGFKTYKNLWLLDRRLHRRVTALNETEMKWAFGELGCCRHEEIVFEAEGCKYYGMSKEHAWEVCEYDEGTEERTKLWEFLLEVNEIACKQEVSESRERIDEEDVYPNEFGILVCEH